MSPEASSVPPPHHPQPNGNGTNGHSVEWVVAPAPAPAPEPVAAAPVPAPRVPLSRSQAVWKHRWAILALALLAGIATYLVAQSLPPRYVSTAHVRVSVTGQNGMDDQTVLAANDLASQYAALSDTAAVQERAAKRLDESKAVIAGAVSTGTVQDQNVMALKAQGSTPAEAQARAAGVAESVVDYVRETARSSVRKQRSSVLAGLGPFNRKSPGEAAERRRARDTVAVALALGVPQLQMLGATSGSKTFPQPQLFAGLAFLLFILAAAQVAVLVEGRRA